MPRRLFVLRASLLAIPPCAVRRNLIPPRSIHPAMHTLADPIRGLLAVTLLRFGLTLTLHDGRAHWHAADAWGAWWRVQIARG